MIHRRALIGSGGMLAISQAARSQPVRKVHRIGIIGSLFAAVDMAGPQTRSPPINALLQGLRELGLNYGEHFITEPRSSEGDPQRLAGLVAELLRQQLDVIVAPGFALAALKSAGVSIPVVMTGSADPVAQGFIHSLARPGGHFTGLTLQSRDTTAKRLQLLREMAGTAGPVAVLWERYTLVQWQVAEAAARERGWKLLSLEVSAADAIEAAFKTASEARAGGLLVFNSGLLDRQAARIAALAASRRLPAMYGLRLYVEAGGLMSYGADLNDMWRRAAVFVDKILRGAKPADLPVEQPTKFELVINLTTAKALGLTIPQALRLRADELIQ